MKVKDIATHNPEVINPDAKLLEAAQKMRKLDVGTLPVCDGKRLIGMITDRDLTIRGTAEGRDPRKAKVRDIMSSEVIWCFEDQELREAADLMETNQIRRLPVLDRNKQLVGIMSLGDVAVRDRNEPIAAEILERVSGPSEVVARA